MKKLIVLIIIAVALLLSGCCPEICPTTPDCICPAYECPDCVCSGGGGCNCPACPACPDCGDCDCPEKEPPEIMLFEANPDAIYYVTGYEISTLSWVVVGASGGTIEITQDIGTHIGLVSAIGTWEVEFKKGELSGTTTYTLTAINSVGSSIAKTTITRVSGQP